MVPDDVREIAEGWDLEVLRATLFSVLKSSLQDAHKCLDASPDGELTTAQAGIVAQLR